MYVIFEMLQTLFFVTLKVSTRALQNTGGALSYIARRENCDATGNFGKSGSEAASQFQGRIARAFSSSILVNTMDMTAAIQYTLTAAQSLGSQVYCKKSRRTILGLDGVLFCVNEQA